VCYIRELVEVILVLELRKAVNCNQELCIEL
jgi:hypothetical protein